MGDVSSGSERGAQDFFSISISLELLNLITNGLFFEYSIVRNSNQFIFYYSCLFCGLLCPSQDRMWKKSLQLSFLSPQILDWFFSRSAPILSIDPVHTDSLWIYEHVQLLRMICRSCCSYGRPRKICDGSLPMLDGRCLAGGTPSRSCTLGTILQYSTRGANTVSYCLFDHNAIHRLVTTR